MRLRNPSHLAFIRTCPCSIAGKNGHVCGGVIEPMHYRGSKDGGMGMKPGDNFTIPGCSDAHREQHQIGERAFEAKYNISMLDICALFWALSPVKDKCVIGRQKRVRERDYFPLGKPRKKPAPSKFKRTLRRGTVLRAA